MFPFFTSGGCDISIEKRNVNTGRGLTYNFVVPSNCEMPKSICTLKAEADELVWITSQFWP